MTYDNYFKFRQISSADYSDYALPAYLSNLLSSSKTLRILATTSKSEVALLAFFRGEYKSDVTPSDVEK
jgi:hypothetical protein